MSRLTPCTATSRTSRRLTLQRNAWKFVSAAAQTVKFRKPAISRVGSFGASGNREWPALLSEISSGSVVRDRGPVPLLRLPRWPPVISGLIFENKAILPRGPCRRIANLEDKAGGL